VNPWNVYETQVMPGSEVQLASARIGFALSGQPMSGLDEGLASPRGLVIAWPSPSVIATYDGAHHWTRSLAIPGGFWGLDVLDANHVWAVGVPALYRSVDGGTSWQRAREPKAPLVRVAFSNAQAGFGLTVKGRLVQTDNAGDSWVASRWHGHGVAMCVPNPGTLLVAARNGEIWRSVNGGRRWVQVASGLTLAQPPVGWATQLSCQGSNAVELSQAFREYAAGGSSTRVRQTTNDGRTWRTIAGQVISAAPTVSRPASVPNALSEAVAVGTRAACLVGGYQDGQRPDIEIGCTAPSVTGHSKGTIPPPPFPGKANGVVVQGVDFLNAQTGWLTLDSTMGQVGKGARAKTEILSTHDGGLTWQPVYLSSSYGPVICPGPEPDIPCGWRNPLR
jgi:hypothetical protein